MSVEPKKRWKEGDTVTFKTRKRSMSIRSAAEESYAHGGDECGGIKATIRAYEGLTGYGCYNITVSFTNLSGRERTYRMLEKEFEEWDRKFKVGEVDLSIRTSKKIKLS